MSKMSKWFNEIVTIERKASSTAWATEPFSVVGVLKGFIQPVSGSMVTARGKVSTGSTHRLYCPSTADIRIGDRVINGLSKEFIVNFTQVEGISGIEDHLEVDMAVK